MGPYSEQLSATPTRVQPGSLMAGTAEVYGRAEDVPSGGNDHRSVVTISSAWRVAAEATPSATSQSNTPAMTLTLVITPSGSLVADCAHVLRHRTYITYISDIIGRQNSDGSVRSTHLFPGHGR